MDQISHERLGDVLTAYFAAASFKEGYTIDELYHFTKAMVETGTQLHFNGIVADKHSTGGVSGSRTTMIIVPIIAAAGFKIPKISSRAITSPAGTADVMETIAKVNFTPRQIEHIVYQAGGCIAWNGYLGIAPADDVLIRVEEPLSFESFDKIIISIMAKKVAVSTNHLILDIPVGKTMKIRHLTDAQKIEEKFKMLGKKFGMKVIVDIDKMSEPAGRGIGPALEMIDVLHVLEQQKDRPLNLEIKALKLASKLLDMCYEDTKINPPNGGGAEVAKQLLSNGSAMKKFREIVKLQGGDDQVSSSNFKIKSHKKEIKIHYSGKIKEINNYNLNLIAKILGAPADKFAGIYLLKKINERFNKNEPLLIMYSQDRDRIKEAEFTFNNFPIYETET